MESNEKIIEELATELAFNYYTVSFGEIKKNGERAAGIDNEEEILKDIFNDELNMRINSQRGLHRCRNIFIVGAGMTYDEYKKIPMGLDARVQIAEKVGFLDLYKDGAIRNSIISDIEQLLKYKIDSSGIGNSRYEVLKQKELFKKYLDRLIGEDKNIFSEIVNRISIQKDKPLSFPDDKSYFDFLIESLDFENFLTIVSKYCNEQRVRDAIKELYEIKYAPHSGYQRLAHLFKHGFIDIIINFNFDELLDWAIENEMGNAEYHHIYSDGDCKNLSEIMVDGRLKVPLYIKPHGTVSHQSTLRFTKNHYLDLPKDIFALLRKLFSGLVSEASEVRLDCVNIIGLGFNFESIELRSLFNVMPKKSKIYSTTVSQDKIPPIYYDLDFIDLTHNKKLTNGKDIGLGNDLSKNIYFLNESPGGTDVKVENENRLVNFIDRLFDKISSYFQPLYKPHGFQKEKIFYSFFSRENSKLERVDLYKKFHSSEHFKKMFIFEAMIYLASNGGNIEPKEALNERIGTYYKLYSKFFEQEGNSHLPDSFYDLLRIFKTKQFDSFSRNVLTVERKEIKSSDVEKIDLNQISIPDSLAGNLIHRILTSRRAILLKNHFFNSELKIDKVLFSDTLEFLKELTNNSTYHEILPKFYDNQFYVFEHFKREQILHTQLSWHYRFNEVFFSGQSWTHLFIVSDYGSFLLKLIKDERFKVQEGKIRIIYLIVSLNHVWSITGEKDPKKSILSDHTLKEVNKILKEKNVKIVITALPYYDHNHHMSIFLNEDVGSILNEGEVGLNIFPLLYIDKKPMACARSFYYYKKGFSRTINPIWIKGGHAFMVDPNTPAPQFYRTDRSVNDHQMLLETFYAYHLKSTNFIQSLKSRDENLNVRSVSPKILKGNSFYYNKGIFKVDEIFDFLRRFNSTGITFYKNFLDR